MNWVKRMRLSFLPIPALLVLIAVLDSIIPPSLFYEPAWLLPITNTLFVTVVCFIVAYIALRNYKATGRVQILLLGSGVLMFGLGGVIAGFARNVPGAGANLNVTIYNTGALGGAIFHFAAAFILLSGVIQEAVARRRGLWLLLGYAGPSVFMGLLTYASLKGLVPPFFIQGVGPTMLRQVVLGTADILFALSWLVFLGTYLRIREVFLYWYSSALALTAISLTAFFIQSSVGSPVGWAGRFSQYLGGIYFLVAIVRAVRSAQSRRTSFDNILTASLSPAEERFRALSENSPDAIARFDRGLKHLYVNPAGLRLYGRPAAAILGRSLEETGLPEPYGRLWSESIRRVFATGEPTEVEGDLPTGTGVQFYQSHCVPEYGSDGSVANVLVVSHDLTERKRAEERMRRHSAVVAGIARIFQEALTCPTEEALGRVCLSVAEEVTQSKFGFVAEINSRTGKLDTIAISDPGWEACRVPDPTGHGTYAPTETTIHGIYGRVVLDGRGFFTNDPASHPDRIGTPPGHPPLTAFLGVPLVHAGQTIGMVGLGNRDGGYRQEELEAAEALAPAIVQAIMHKRAEAALATANAALRESEAKYRNLFENMAEEVHFWQLVRDEAGRIKTWRLVDANPPTLRTWGKTLEEIKGKTTDEIFGPGATEHYMPVVQKITTEGVPYSFEDYFPNLDKHFRFTSVPLGDYFITTGADITSIKKAQEALQRAHDELEDRVQERTAELSQTVENLATEVGRRLQAEEALRRLNEELETRVQERTAALEEANRKLEVVNAQAEDANIQLEETNAQLTQEIEERERAKVLLAEANTALRESESRYRGLVELAPDAVLVHQDWQIVYANAVALRLYGAASPEHLCGRHMLDLVHPADRDVVRERVHQEQIGATGPLRELRHIRLDGQEVAVESTAAPVQWQGKPAIQVVIRDITERKQTEHALRDSEERYSSLFEHMLNGFAYCRMLFEQDQPSDFIYLAVNRAFRTLTGLPDVVGKRVSEVIPGIRETDPGLFELYGRVARTGVPERFERYVEALGMWFAVAVYSPGQDHFVAVFDVITERKRAEEEAQRLLALVQQEKERLSALVNSIHDEVWFADTQKRFTLVNPSGLREFGLHSADGTLELQVEGFAGGLEVYRADGSLRPIEEAPPLRALSGEVVRNLEEIIRTPASGALRYRQVSAAPVRDATGAIIGSVSVVRDITELKQAEEALRKAHADLELRVQERTAELAQSVEALKAEVARRTLAEEVLWQRSLQLRALASELTLAEQRERRRVAEVLHDDLQQLLVGARLQLSGLQRGSEKAVNQTASDVEALINQALAVSRSLTHELSPPILHEGEMVPALEWLARWMQERHGLQVTITEKSGPPSVSYDAKVLLFQAVRELLFNVVKHAQVPKASLSVGRRGDQIQIVVGDDGAGFDPALLHEGGEGGRGFGLFSIRERLEMIGGSLEIDSAPGKGSRFTLVAPLASTGREGAP